MSEKVSIIGGGSWGTALAEVLAENGRKVLIYVRDKEIKDNINFNHINNKYFPKFKLANDVESTTNLEKAVTFGSFLVLTVPTHVTRSIMKKINSSLSSEQIIVSTAKGIEEETNLRNSEIISTYCKNDVAVLSGPTHSEEVIQGLPSAAVIAAHHKHIAESVQDLFMSPTFRFYTNSDLIGVELGGAVKNVISVAAGIIDGLGYGDNTKAALITRGLTEMSRFGIYLGGRPITFAGLAGMGDLVVTCTSMHSRNRRFGINIGKGMSVTEALNNVNQVVEGVKTTRAIYNLIKEDNINVELPITEQIYQVLFENKSPLEAVDELMLRGPKHEMEDVVNIDW